MRTLPIAALALLALAPMALAASHANTIDVASGPCAPTGHGSDDDSEPYSVTFCIPWNRGTTTIDPVTEFEGSAGRDTAVFEIVPFVWPDGDHGELRWVSVSTVEFEPNGDQVAGTDTFLITVNDVDSTLDINLNILVFNPSDDSDDDMIPDVDVDGPGPQVPDACPTIAAGVFDDDFNGCPDSDNDGDGISGEDTDGDGSPDDTCPDIHANDLDNTDMIHNDGDATDVDGNGCPDSDNDGDGISGEDTDGDGSPEDMCPDTHATAGGGTDADSNGCPDSDNDGDGVPNDGTDACPDVPADTADGCPDDDRDGDGISINDTDGDGAPDDACPDIHATSGPDGITGNTDDTTDTDTNGCPDSDNDGDGLSGDDPDGSGQQVPPDACPDRHANDRVFNDANGDGIDDSNDGMAKDTNPTDGCPDLTTMPDMRVLVVGDPSVPNPILEINPLENDIGDGLTVLQEVTVTATPSGCPELTTEPMCNEITTGTDTSVGIVSVAGGTVTFTPADGFDGNVTIDITVRDRPGHTEPSIINIDVQPPTLAPNPITIVFTPGTDVEFMLSEYGVDAVAPIAIKPIGEDHDPSCHLSAATGSDPQLTFESPGTCTETAEYDLRFDDSDGERARVVVLFVTGGGSDDDHDKRPTFGLSHSTFERIVECGYSMDGECRNVDAYHVEYEREMIETGSEHDFRLKVYGADPISWFEIGFGVPEVGSTTSEAEALIHVEVFPEFESEDGYGVGMVEYDNDAGVIGEDAEIYVYRDACAAADEEERCVVLEVNGVEFREQMYHEPFVILAMDNQRRTSTHYMNDGLLVQGDSLNPLPEHVMSDRPTSQGAAEHMTIYRTDKLANLWTDGTGYEFTRNGAGTWLVLDRPAADMSSACTDADSRLCDAFADKLAAHNARMLELRDGLFEEVYTTESFDDLADAVSIHDLGGDSRTAFLDRAGMAWIRG